MPTETKQAIAWAYTQTYTDFDGNHQSITKTTKQPLVDAVRAYFNTNNISYKTFSYTDLQQYL